MLGDSRTAHRLPLGYTTRVYEPTLHAAARRELRKSEELDGRHSDALVALHDAFDIARRRIEDVARRQRGDVKSRAVVT